MATNVEAPAGAHWEYEEVKTDRGQTSLGEVPLLVWDSVDAAVQFYGEEGVRDMLDGTSARVSFQSIGRRLKAAGKSDDEIAQAITAFRPGKRTTTSTPVSRASRAAKSAAEATGNGDLVAALLEKIARGEIDPASLLG